MICFCGRAGDLHREKQDAQAPVRVQGRVRGQDGTNSQKYSQTLLSSSKYTRALTFENVRQELDRDSRTLRFCVDNKQWVTLTGVARDARPFLNFFTSGDGATLLQAEDGASIPTDLI